MEIRSLSNLGDGNKMLGRSLLLFLGIELSLGIELFLDIDVAKGEVPLKG